LFDCDSVTSRPAETARRGLSRARRLSLRGALGVLAPIAYAGVAVQVVLSMGGVPASRDVLVPLVLGGFLALSVTSARRLRRLAVGIAVDWLPIVLALWLYDFIRGYADGGWLPVHFGRQIELDRLVGLGTLPSVWLQRHLWHGAQHVAWYDYATWLVYMSYFFATTAVLAALWWYRPGSFRRYAATVVGLAVAGCATFVLYPAEPPWMAANVGQIPHLDRIVQGVNGHLPVVTLAPLWERGTQYANDVAAVPSLHASYTLLIALFFFRRLRTRWRHLLWLYPLAMAFALVYTGEHYVSDIVLGWIYCVGVYAAVERVANRLSQRHAEPAPALAS
jgi:membrane-associated phospholipid phosphatase